MTPPETLGQASSRANRGDAPSSLSGTERFLALLALLAGVALFVVGLGSIPLQCGNETMYVYPPIAMLETGDLLVPHYLHGPFLDKPPLTFWLIAASYRLFGVSLTAGRLPGVRAALATVRLTVNRS